MQIVTLNIADHAVEKVMAVLNALPKQEVQVVATPSHHKSKKSMEALYGMLSPYVDKRLSDEEIENAIAQGAYESGMAGKVND